MDNSQLKIRYIYDNINLTAETFPRTVQNDENSVNLHETEMKQK